MQMRGRRWLAVAIAVGSISTGVAIAGGGTSETTPVTGDFHADLVKQKQRPCDAKNTKFELRFRGTQTSSDPRLVGDFEADVESVVNNESGWGRTSGDVVVRSTYSPKAKFRGTFVGVVEPDGGAEGFLTGEVRSGRHGSVRLLANFNVDQDMDTGAITGEFGKDSQTTTPYSPEEQDPAILTNACSGHHHHHGGHHH
jgi:hypothetical protein